MRETPHLYDAVLNAPEAYEKVMGTLPTRITLQAEPDPEGDPTLSLIFELDGTPEDATDLCRAINRSWTINLPENVGRRNPLESASPPNAIPMEKLSVGR